MLKIPPFASLLTFGTFFIAMGLVMYRLLWAASQASQFTAGSVLPKKLQGLRRWLHGEPAYKKPQ
jgi:hypothetical protein